MPHVLLGCNDFQSENKVISISCGVSHLAAITSLGDLYMWGKNREACLGLGHMEDQCIPLKVTLKYLVICELRFLKKDRFIYQDKTCNNVKMQLKVNFC